MIKQRTIGGKRLDEVFRELQKEFPPDKIKQHISTKMLYVSAKDIETRFNEVLGIENWDFILLSEPRIYKFGEHDYESCVVSGKLSIYDDDRIPIIRSAGGGADVIYPKKSDRPTSVPNVIDSATSDVFKRCARRFGVAIISKRQRDDMKSATLESMGSSNLEDVVSVSVKVLEPFKELNKGGAKVKVLYNSDTMELIIWKNKWDELQMNHPDTFKIGNKLNNINLNGIISNYKGEKQLVFYGLAKGVV